MSLVGKPRPGVCGRCGCAVVRSLEPVPAIGRIELHGHFYDHGRLVTVRCYDHGGGGFAERQDGWGLESRPTVFGHD